jgi:hypothetical protein
MFSPDTIIKAVVAIVTSELGQTIIKELVGNYIEEEQAIDRVRHNRVCCACGSSARCYEESTREDVALHRASCPTTGTQKIAHRKPARKARTAK